jgi:hypothetical protein
MGDFALIASLIGYLVFGFLITVALARLMLALADLAERLGRKDPPDGK